MVAYVTCVILTHAPHACNTLRFSCMCVYVCVCLRVRVCVQRRSSRRGRSAATDAAGESVETVVIGEAGGSVRCLHGETGAELWCNERVVVEGGLTGLACTKTSAPASEILVAGSANGALVRVAVERDATAAAAGALSEIAFSQREAFGTSTAVAADGDVAFVGFSGGSLVASRQSSGGSRTRMMATLSGHSSRVVGLDCCGDGRVAVSAAVGERSVTVWYVADTDYPRSSRRAAQPLLPAMVLPTAHPAVAVSCQLVETAAGDGDGSDESPSEFVLVTAVMESGEALFWSLGLRAGSDDGGRAVLETGCEKPIAKVCVGVSGRSEAVQASIATGERIIGVFVLHAETTATAVMPPTVLVCRGQRLQPMFERVNLSVAGEKDTEEGAPDDMEEDNPTRVIMLAPRLSGLFLKQKGGASPAAGAAAADADDDVAATTTAATTSPSQKKRQRPAIVGSRGLTGAAPTRASVRENADAGNGKRNPDGGVNGDVASDHDGDDDTALGDKVAALDLEENGGGAAVAATTSGGAVALANGFPAGPPTAESLANLLAQALQGGDRQLLEHCLAVSDERVIKKTMRRLPPSLAVPFLQVTLPRLESRAGRGVSLTPWLKHLLHTHAGHLMTAPAAQEHLASLSQVVESRVSLLPQLLRLAGRLDLVLSQLPDSDRDRGADDMSSRMGLGPALIYDDVNDDVPAVDAYRTSALIDGALIADNNNNNNNNINNDDNE